MALPLHSDGASGGFTRHRPGERRGAEPALVIPAETLEAWRRARPAASMAAGALPDLAANTNIPLAGTAAKAGPSRFWKAAIGVSVALHAAAGLFFVTFADDEALIAGGEQAQVALLGNAAEDQISAGETAERDDAEVTSVTIVPLVQARPVETVEAEAVSAEPVAVSEAAILQPVDPNESVEMAEPDVVQPVEPQASQPVQANALAPVEPADTSPPIPAAPLEEAPEPVEQPAIASSTVPEVLTAQRLDPAETENVVPIPATPVDQVTPAEAQAAAAQPVAPVPQDAEPIRPVEETPPKPVVAEQPKPKAKPAPKPAPVARAKPKPEIVREAKARPVPLNEAKADNKARETNSAASAAGAKGKNKTDARRGDADGSKDGRSAGKNTGAKRNSAAGNAAVTNYPGKIVSKLRRALRYPAAARSQGLRGEVQVAFTVSASGGVGGIRVVRSSGSPILDKAAVETVRRAAPFPPIPDGAGRSSWPFSVPLAFTR